MGGKVRVIIGEKVRVRDFEKGRVIMIGKVRVIIGEKVRVREREKVRVRMSKRVESIKR